MLVALQELGQAGAIRIAKKPQAVSNRGELLIAGEEYLTQTMVIVSIKISSGDRSVVYRSQPNVENLGFTYSAATRKLFVLESDRTGKRIIETVIGSLTSNTLLANVDASHLIFNPARVELILQSGNELSHSGLPMAWRGPRDRSDDGTV